MRAGKLLHLCLWLGFMAAQFVAFIWDSLVM